MKHSIPFLICYGFVAYAFPAAFVNAQNQQAQRVEKKKTAEVFRDATKSVTRTLSVYSDYYEGRTMSNGKKFSQKGFTVASNDWKLGTRLILRYNGKSVSVVVTDRMASRFSGKRVDASKAVWNYLTGNAKPGLRRVEVSNASR